MGKNESFRHYLNIVKKAKKEVLIISIGEPVIKELTLANRNFIKRGGQLKMIIHKYNENNRSLLESWKKMGWQIRHYKDWGYYLVVIDKKICMISANNPKHTDERISIYFYNPALAKALANYFYTLWEKAVEI
ncbi:hypothetical protein KKD62_03335 [Patescibacteria group bacterium]|nr:hypothetical protein [Patescibacteria group bacterium]MBU1931320.1 hypothetical protein [Patescibacteria group bacterium]